MGSLLFFLDWSQPWTWWEPCADVQGGRWQSCPTIRWISPLGLGNVIRCRTSGQLVGTMGVSYRAGSTLFSFMYLSLFQRLLKTFHVSDLTPGLGTLWSNRCSWNRQSLEAKCSTAREAQHSVVGTVFEVLREGSWGKNSFCHSWGSGGGNGSLYKGGEVCAESTSTHRSLSGEDEEAPFKQEEKADPYVKQRPVIEPGWSSGCYAARGPR